MLADDSAFVRLIVQLISVCVGSSRDIRALPTLI